MLEWMRLNESFPSVWLLRRYIKLAARYCEVNRLMDSPLDDALLSELPFEV